MYLPVLLLVMVSTTSTIALTFSPYQIPKAVVALPFNEGVTVSSDTNRVTLFTLNNNFSSDPFVLNSSKVSTNKTIEQHQILLAIYSLSLIKTMVVTKQQVIEILNVDEPNYPEAAKLGPDALPHLDTLVKTADPMLASKAAYLASLIQSDQSIDVLRAAAQSDHPEVRVAAAAGARNRVAAAAGARKSVSDDSINELLSLLNNDQDAGVRKEAAKSLKSIRGTE
jgi:hypothetical protein